MAGYVAIVFGIGTALELGVQLISIASAGMLGRLALGALTSRENGHGTQVGIVVCILFTPGRDSLA